MAVTGISNATAISAGGFHSCALLSNGQVDCWGDNEVGQLGNGTTGTYVATPVQVTGISNATAISAGTGGAHSCALLATGRVECWGSNDYGQLGNGSTTDSSTPVQVSGISNATAISAGGAHSCALLATGEIYCWGLNEDGQLGNGEHHGQLNAGPGQRLPGGYTVVLVILEPSRGIRDRGHRTHRHSTAAG